MPTHHRFVFLVLMAAVVLATTAGAKDSPWPMFRHDLKHTGRTTYTGPDTAALIWTYQTGDGVASSPTIGKNGTIYVGSGWLWSGAADSNLYALNPNGTLKWKYRAIDGVFSSPAIGPDGTIYFTCIGGYAYAVHDSVTYAKLKWQSPSSGPFLLSSPLVGPEGHIYFGSPDLNFYVADSSDGHIIWKFRTNWCIISSAAVIDDGTIYVGSKDHHLYAFRNDLQDTLWSFSTGTFYDGHLVDASPAVGTDGTIYVGSDEYGAFGHPPVPVDTSFWAVNPDGSRKWAMYIGNGVESSPALGADGTIYFGSFDSCFYAVADSGSYPQVKWKFRTGGVVDGSPTIDDEGIIYFGSRDSTIYAMYPNGTVKWSYKTGGGIESSPTIDNDGRLYIGSFDGKVYCLGTGAPDMAVVGIDLPATVETGFGYAPTARIRNLRNHLQSLSLACIIDDAGAVVYADTLAVPNFPADTTAARSFAPWTVGPTTGVTYTVTVSIILPEDKHPYNNEQSTEVVSQAGTFVCGDANHDGGVNVGDAVFIIGYVFRGGPPPTPLQAADVNNDAKINIGDAVYLIGYIFRGGPLPNCP